jgi:hypothetical protein
MNLVYISAALIFVTAMVHSFLGEKRLIGPILALETGIVARPLARAVLRFAWHLTSVLMLLTALLLVWPGTPIALIRITAAAYLLVGLIDAVVTRGKHVGWPMLAGAGVLALVGAGT